MTAADPALVASMLQTLETVDRATRFDLRKVADGVRFLKRTVRAINNVPAGIIFVWPVLVFWLVPAALRTSKMKSHPTIARLVEESRALPKRNWGEEPDFEKDPLDDIVALRDSRMLFLTGIFIPPVLFLAAGFLVWRAMQ
jgi:hypothetical protein